MIAFFTFIWNNWKIIFILLAVGAVYFLGAITGADHVQREWDHANELRSEMIQKQRDKEEKQDYALSAAYEKQHEADVATVAQLQKQMEAINAKNTFPADCHLDAQRLRLVNSALSAR